MWLISYLSVLDFKRGYGRRDDGVRPDRGGRGRRQERQDHGVHRGEGFRRHLQRQARGQTGHPRLQQWVGRSSDESRSPGSTLSRFTSPPFFFWLLPACEVSFDNVPVPLENVIGEVGGGFKVRFLLLNGEHGRLACSIASPLYLHFKNIS